MLCRQQLQQPHVDLVDYNSRSCDSEYAKELNCCHALCNGYMHLHRIYKEYIASSAFIFDMAQILGRSR